MNKKPESITKHIHCYFSANPDEPSQLPCQNSIARPYVFMISRKTAKID